MADNPIKYSDLFNFDDDGVIKKAIADINKLKKSYTDFFNTVINGQIGRLQLQLNELAAENNKLAASTRELSIAQKANQKALLDNLKTAEQNATATRKLKEAQADTARAGKTVSDGVKTLTQQYAALKKEYDKAFQANDTAKLVSTRQKLKELNVQILQLNAGLKSSSTGFRAAAGSYAELDQRTKQLVASLKAMPGGLSATNREAQALKKEIYANTQRLKEFDREINQNFRNVGNYGSALNGLGNSVKSLALTYVSITGLIALVSRIGRVNAEISDGMSDVRRTAQLTAAEASNLVEQLKKIDTRTSLKGLLDIAVIGGQLGIAKDQLAGFTRAIDQLSVTLSGEIKGGATEIASALGKINGVFKVQAKEGTDVERAFNKTGSAILALGQAGLATGEFLQDFSLRTAGVANQAKISLPTILAYAAVLEETGSSAEVAGTAMNRLIGSLASKREKFFNIAKIGDATLTLKSFTDLINKDANAALQKFFQGLNAGGKDLTSFTDLLDQIGLKAGPSKNAIIALAQNQDLLNERIGEAVEAYDKGTLAADQFKIKNDNLAGSVKKLSNEFDKAVEGDGVGKFFKQMVDGARNGLSAIDKIFKSRSFNELFNRLFTFDASRFDVVNSAKDNFTSSVSTKKELLKQNPLSGNGVVTGLEAKSPEQLKGILAQYQKAYENAYHAYSVYYDGVKNGVVKETTEPGTSINDYKKNAEELLYLGNQVAAAYKKKSKEVAAVIKSDDKLVADSFFQTTAEIQAKIKELQNDALKNPANKEKDIAQIKVLKAQLRELSGANAAVGTSAKEGFAVLEDQLAKLEKELQKSVVAGKTTATDFDSPLVKKVNAARIALNRFKDAYESALRGQAPVIERKGDPNTAMNFTGLDKTQNSIDSESYSKKLEELELITREYNIKILKDFKDRNINKEQMDALLLNSEIANTTLSYGYRKRQLELELRNTALGSKERIRILNQIAELEENNTNDEIARAKKVEKVRIEAIKNVFDAIRPNISILTDQLGSGFGNVFSTLSSNLEKFFEEGKEGFTTFADKFTAIGQITSSIAGAFTEQFKAASEARIEQLNKEREKDLLLAGNNEEAKAAINARFDKKVAEQKRKAAIADKANALFQIAINTAIGVANAASKVITLPLIPLIIGLGLAQAVLVAARPIPKFAKGTDNAPGGEAWVGEQGPELIEEDGKYRMSPAVATRTVLKKGAKVKTATETKAIIDHIKILNNQFGNQYLDSMLQGTAGIRRAGDASNAQIIAALNNGQITEEQISRAMSKAISKTPVQKMVLDEYGFRVFNIEANHKKNDQKTRMRMGGNG